MVDLHYGALKLINRLFAMLVVYPAVGIFALLAVGSGFSFNGAAQWFTDMQYEAQQLGKAEQAGHMLVKRCDESHQVQGEMPKLAVCQRWNVQEVSVEAATREGGRTFRNQYVMFLVLGFGFMLLRDFSPILWRRMKSANSQVNS